MDKAVKKRLKNQARQREREAAFRALPLAVEELRAMFGMLHRELAKMGWIIRVV